jgi:hypothetical protein
VVKNLVRWRTAKAAVGDATDPATAVAPPVEGAPDILFRAVAIDPPGVL